MIKKKKKIKVWCIYLVFCSFFAFFFFSFWAHPNLFKTLMSHIHHVVLKADDRKASPTSVPSGCSHNNLSALSSPRRCPRGRFQLNGRNVWDILISLPPCLSLHLLSQDGRTSASMDKAIFPLALCRNRKDIAFWKWLLYFLWEGCAERVKVVPKLQLKNGNKHLILLFLILIAFFPTN